MKMKKWKSWIKIAVFIFNIKFTFQKVIILCLVDGLTSVKVCEVEIEIKRRFLCPIV
jgi:hypothetical protein